MAIYAVAAVPKFKAGNGSGIIIVGVHPVL